MGILADFFVATPEDAVLYAETRCVGEWAETEELSCEAAELEPVLRSLVDLAGKATASGRGMFLWGPL